MLVCVLGLWLLSIIALRSVCVIDLRQTVLVQQLPRYSKNSPYIHLI